MPPGRTLLATPSGMNRSVPEAEIEHLTIKMEDPSAKCTLEGSLEIPPAPIGWVIFAHGSGSSRLSPRNLQVAQALQQAHLATLLFDLLTPDESSQRKNVFDIPLLTRRLMLAIDALRARQEYNRKPLVLFGASTGAAAALEAAALPSSPVEYVVSRGGRVDLARNSAPGVRARTLLIVGGNDEPILSWNRETMPLLRHGELRVVPRAGHLFEEPGALLSVIDATSRFLTKYLKPSRPATTLHP
jgi:putative phosphoribosyl transferase